MTATDAPTAADGADRAARPVPRVAYVVSRFPRLTETFVVDEVDAVVRAGADVAIHPLHRERTDVVQPMATALAPRVRHRSLLSPRVALSTAGSLVRRPRDTVDALATVVRETRRSRRLLVGALISFPFAVDLGRRLRAEGVDHLHCHFATHPAAVGWVVNRLTGLPFSFTAHGSDLHRDRAMLRSKVESAAFVVAISQHNRDVIVEACGAALADRVHVVHCGIDHSQFAFRRRHPRAPGDPLHVCCVGTLHEVKGQAVLIDACARLRREGLDVRCTLVGDGPDRASLEARAREAGLADRVEVTGRVARPEVRAVLDEADLLVAPSVPTADGRREGIPVVILEAMASGVPVVASRLSGIPEVVRDGVTGLLAEPGDVEGVARAMAQVADDPEAARDRAGAAAALVADEFDVDRSARRLVALFAGART